MNNNNNEDIEIKYLRFKLGWLQNKYEEKRIKHQHGEKKNSIKFNSKKYLNYFKKEYQKKEEEEIRATTIDVKINLILNKKKGIEKEIEKYEKNFYSMEYKPIKKIKSFLKGNPKANNF